jgi:oligopeptide/dipeptide ABC transporter ATP-binding protein
MSASPLIALRDVSVTFATGPRRVRALDHCSFELQAGETLAVIGESGSGKSTLARVIAGLVTPTSGSVHFRGETLDALPKTVRRRIQMVFQDPDASLNPAHRVSTILAEPLEIRRYGSSVAIEQRILELLRKVRLDSSLLERRPHQLSGGQKQRVAIARALAMDPELIIADEPLSSLDAATAASIAQLFRDLRDELSISMLFISHDLRVVRQLASRVAVMYAGEIVEFGLANVLDQPQHPYTKLLTASMPSDHGVLDLDLIEAMDAVPRLRFATSGCGYRERCSHRDDVCATAPALVGATSTVDHLVRCHVCRS